MFDLFDQFKRKKQLMIRQVFLCIAVFQKYLADSVVVF